MIWSNQRSQSTSNFRQEYHDGPRSALNPRNLVVGIVPAASATKLAISRVSVPMVAVEETVPVTSVEKPAISPANVLLAEEVVVEIGHATIAVRSAISPVNALLQAWEMHPVVEEAA
jgi:hypothetical protein